MQALEGKDVKDLLLNVGSGGGAATVSSGGAPAAGGAAAPEAPKEEEKKEEGRTPRFVLFRLKLKLTISQRRKSQTKTWVSVFSTKGFHIFRCTYIAWLGLSLFGATFDCLHRDSKLNKGFLNHLNSFFITCDR